MAVAKKTLRLLDANLNRAREGLREAYLQAITSTLERCTPMPFTDAMGGAVAGRPIAIRFIDDRPIRVEQQ